MWQYLVFDLDPDSDIDDALERYRRAGWQTWAAGRGAVTVVNGRRVHRVSLRRDSTSGPRLSQPTAQPLQ